MQVRPKIFPNGCFIITGTSEGDAAVGRHPECNCRTIRLFIVHPMLKRCVGWVCDCERTVLDYDLKYGEEPKRKETY